MLVNKKIIVLTVAVLTVSNLFSAQQPPRAPQRPAARRVEIRPERAAAMQSRFQKAMDEAANQADQEKARREAHEPLEMGMRNLNLKKNKNDR